MSDTPNGDGSPIESRPRITPAGLAGEGGRSTTDPETFQNDHLRTWAIGSTNSDGSGEYRPHVGLRSAYLDELGRRERRLPGPSGAEEEVDLAVAGICAAIAIVVILVCAGVLVGRWWWFGL